MGKIKFIAGLIDMLPKKMGDNLTEKLIYGYIDKFAHIHVEGYENIQEIEGPCIFVCNHLSNADGIILNRVLKQFDPTFVAGIKLAGEPVTKLGLRVTRTIPIKPNSADKEALTKVIKTLKEGNNIMIFPEGTRSRSKSMMEAKKGILLIARMSKAKIIPLGMWGTEELLPINKDGDMGKETFHEAEVKINIGKPIENIPKKDKDEDKHQYEERCLKHLMKHVAELVPESYRGIYK